MVDAPAEYRPFLASAATQAWYDAGDAEREQVIARSGRPAKPLAASPPIHRHAGDRAQLLDAPRPTVVAGNFMGAREALELALESSERMSALCPLDGFACEEHCLLAFEQTNEGVARTSTLVPLFTRVSFGTGFGWHPDGDDLESIDAGARGVSAYDARDRPREIRVPALAVGNEDWSCPLDPSSRALADGIAESTPACLPCGHLPMLEVADRFEKLPVGFLAERLGLMPDAGPEAM